MQAISGLLDIYPRPAEATPVAPRMGCACHGTSADACQGSRRKRLWELGANTHCPVVGVCLPIAALRKLVDKALGGAAQAVDYELHCGVIAECRLRSPIAEALNKELDRRYAVALRQSARARSTEALAAWWREASTAEPPQGAQHRGAQRGVTPANTGPDLPGALWATLTHARCDDALQCQVLGEVHMLQHQVGSAQRVDHRLLNTLMQEKTALRDELTALQQRCQQQVGEHAREAEALHKELTQRRAQQLADHAEAHALRTRLAEQEEAAPGTRGRADAEARMQQQATRIAVLEEQLRLARLESGRLRAESQALRSASDVASPESPDAAGTTPLPATSATDLADESPAELQDRAVLCVGGRPASVPLYRHIVERTGGRFLHHDGGEEQNLARLESTLTTADLVICQTGCISHDAYWRVKNHCKRTGTPCVFVENPGSASLKRALTQLVGSTAAREAAAALNPVP